MNDDSRIGLRVSLLVINSLLLMAAAGCVRQSAERPGSTGPDVPKADLRLSYDARKAELTIEVLNTGEVGFRVDNELVFFVDIGLTDTHDEAVGLDVVSALPRPPAAEFQKRFVILPPHHSLTRRVLLREGFKDFSYGWSSDHQRVAASEVICKFRDFGGVPSRIWVTYGIPLLLSPAAFESYTGIPLRSSGFYPGPVLKVLKLVDVGK